MQVTLNRPANTEPSLGRKIGFFLLPLVVALVLVATGLALTVATYEARHQGRVYTGVSLWGVDLGGMTRDEAAVALGRAFPYQYEAAITFTDPQTGATWSRSPADLGIAIDVETTLDAALGVGRSGGAVARLRDQVDAWYYGMALAPVVVFNEALLDTALNALATDVDRPPVDAQLVYSGSEINFTPAQTGRLLDRGDARQRLLNPLANLRYVELELLIHETQPGVLDTSQTAAAIKTVLSAPITLFLAEPLGDDDLERLTISIEQLTRWLRIETVTAADGTQRHDVFMDENGLRAWLGQYADALYRAPKRARYYFDDPTGELVLVEPHIDGRALDIDATIAQFKQQIGTPNRSVPLVMEKILPTAHSEARAVDLGIIELLEERTTYFYGSSPERKHNIARAAANFYGIVIGPGEEFSFNQFLGDVTEEQGYETGLIILGGRTVEGVGGGVCQVSTTIFQAAWWAGFPVVERLEHGYQVGYYNDGEGAGMDATVFSPLVDFRFINNTPNHLLIENYYNEVTESLTFKFYSTATGRTVEKAEFIYENVQEAKPDVWEYNDELEPGEIEQVDWAVEGADVRVRRVVYNADEELIRDEWFVSNYIPWRNIYQYGSGAPLPPGVNRDPADPTAGG